jgi:hypothetical protein
MNRSRTVYVYRIDLDSPTAAFNIPEGARFLHAAPQHGDIALWYEIPDREAPEVRHLYELYGTGHSIPNDAKRDYLATTLHFNGTLVLHVYEVAA